jgi:uroporphyrinogen III methyltransferase/synthase
VDDRAPSPIAAPTPATAPAAPRPPIGKVYLVGAGPGSAAYLTLRAWELLAQAEVLVYDALVDRALLDRVPAACHCIEVGKRGGRPSTQQRAIDRLLVDHCQAGHLVVRLKGGDPFVFGRSASEIQALAAAGCPVEVVPGLSSALVAPLVAGIPLTDPVLSRCFAVASAHEPDALNWEALAQLETLVFLMGGRSLGVIAERLMRSGKRPDTPVAIVRSAGQPQQQIWIGNLAAIAVQTAGIRLSPAVIVVGEVVHLHKFLAVAAPPMPLGPTAPLFQSLSQSSGDRPMEPLTGRTVLVTRAAGQAGSFVQQLTAVGARAIELPALEIGPPTSWEPLDRAIAAIETYDWLILTSANGVEALLGRLAIAGRDVRALATVKIAVVGQKTADALSRCGLRPDFIPTDFIADRLAADFPEDPSDRRILFPRVETGGRDVLVKNLRDRGAIVDEVAAYESRCPAELAPAARQALEARQVDIVTFASSKTAHNFAHLLRAIDRGHNGSFDLLQGVCIASIGPQTSDACREAFGRVDLEAEEYTLDGLRRAIVTWVSQP